MCKVSFFSAVRQHKSRLQRSCCCRHKPAEAQLTILDIFNVISYHTSVNRQTLHRVANHMPSCVFFFFFFYVFRMSDSLAQWEKKRNDTKQSRWQRSAGHHGTATVWVSARAPFRASDIRWSGSVLDGKTSSSGWYRSVLYSAFSSFVFFTSRSKWKQRFLCGCARLIIGELRLWGRLLDLVIGRLNISWYPFSKMALLKLRQKEERADVEQIR